MSDDVNSLCEVSGAHDHRVDLREREQKVSEARCKRRQSQAHGKQRKYVFSHRRQRRLLCHRSEVGAGEPVRLGGDVCKADGAVHWDVLRVYLQDLLARVEVGQRDVNLAVEPPAVLYLCVCTVNSEVGKKGEWSAVPFS